MRSAISFFMDGEHGYPDPDLESMIDLEACVALRDGARDEVEYMEWDAMVSQALVERQYWQQLIADGDPCATGEHCPHKHCKQEYDQCCWCGKVGARDVH